MTQRWLVRTALRATLVKRPADLDVFDLLFDRHFPPTGPDDVGGASGASAAAVSAGGRATDLATLPPHAAPELGDAIIDAVRRGDDGLLGRLADGAVARYSGIDAGEVGERAALYRVLRAVDLSNLLVTVMARHRAEHPDSSPFQLGQVRSDARRRIAQLERLVAAAIRARLATRRAARPPIETVVRRLEDVDVVGATASELETLRSAVRPLARALASRVGGQARRHRRGRLDVRRTIRRSLDAGGTPLDPAWRRRRAIRPQVVVLCDISGSVAEFARFMLMLLHAVRAELAGLRAFVFVDGIAEVTGVIDGAAGVLDPRLLVTLPGVVADDGHSDYGRVLATFHDRFGDAVGPGTTVLVVGDARTNGRDAGAPWLRLISARCRRLYWLDPEPMAEWTDPGSSLDEYRPWCDGVFEVRNLRQLGRAVAAIV